MSLKSIHTKFLKARQAAAARVHEAKMPYVVKLTEPALNQREHLGSIGCLDGWMDIEQDYL